MIQQSGFVLELLFCVRASEGIEQSSKFVQEFFCENDVIWVADVEFVALGEMENDFWSVDFVPAVSAEKALETDVVGVSLEFLLG